MANTKAQREGLEFEESFAALFGASLQPGSGSQWFAKLDARGRQILWSLKHTGKDSLRVTQKILSESIQEATKIGSPGAIPGLGIDIAGEPFVVMRATDVALIFQEDIRIAPPQGNEIKRQRSRMPLALRRLEEDDD
jgi:hypothetical protein